MTLSTCPDRGIRILFVFYMVCMDLETGHTGVRIAICMLIAFIPEHTAWEDRRMGRTKALLPECTDQQSWANTPGVAIYCWYKPAVGTGRGAVVLVNHIPFPVQLLGWHTYAPHLTMGYTFGHNQALYILHVLYLLILYYYNHYFIHFCYLNPAILNHESEVEQNKMSGN